MRTCPLCESKYPDDVEVCRACGASISGGSPGGVERTASIAALSPAPGITRTSDIDHPEKDFSAILSAADDPARAVTENPEGRIGEVLGSYKLVEIIGRGGMGCVYRAQHTRLGRDVALKLLRQDYAQRRDAVARFFQEAKAVNLIKHKNIVDIIDYVELEDGTVFIIMELLAGHSLGRLMRTPGQLNTARSLAILTQICDGLSAAHDVGIVHRDLKPDNIIVLRNTDDQDQVKILDFGVAKLIDKNPGSPELTAVGSVIGTPAYMSPEQAGGLAVDPRSDVYSLGAIIYEIFTKKTPFRAKTFGEYVRMHLSEKPVPPRLMPGGNEIDPRLDGIILRCLDKSPNARFQSARDLKASLVNVMGSLEAVPPTPAAGLAAASSANWKAPMRAPSHPGSPHRAPSHPPPSHPVPSHPVGDMQDAGYAAPAERTMAMLSESGPRGLPVEDTRWHDDPPQAHGERQTPYPAPPGHTPQGKTPTPIAFAYGTADPMTQKSGKRPLPKRRPGVAIIAIAAATAGVGFAIAVPWMLSRSNDDGRAEASEASKTAIAAAPGDEGSTIGARIIETTSRGQPAKPVEPDKLVTPGSGTKPADDADVDVKPALTATSPGKQSTGAKTAASKPTRHDRAAEKAAAERAAAEKAAAAKAAAAKAAAAAPSPIVVRIESQPSARLIPAGGKGALCQTPCAVTIDPADGGSTKRRQFILKRDGFIDETVSIILAKPPAQLRVQLVAEKKKPDPKTTAASKDPGKTPTDESATFNPFGDPPKKK